MGSQSPEYKGKSLLKASISPTTAWRGNWHAHADDSNDEQNHNAASFSPFNQTSKEKAQLR
jgi:hypothetical protein